MAPGFTPSTSGMAAIANMRNNTHPLWWKDKGLTKLSLGLVVGFAATINSGYDGSLMNGLLTMPIFVSAIGTPDGNMLGIITAAYSLGSLASVFAASWVADRFGRKPSMFIGAVTIIAGSIFQAFSKGGVQFLISRLIIGLGGGFQNVAGGPYVSEIAHPRNRPQALALVNTCWYIGSIIAAWTTFGTLQISNHWCWKIPCLVQAVPCILQLVALWFVPESPRYFVSTGKEDVALNILAKYHANGDTEDELVLFEFEEMKAAIQHEKNATEGVSYKSFLKTKGNRHRLLILFCVGIFSQWVGNGIISYYLAKILASIGITNPNQQAGLNGGLQIWNWFWAIAGSLACERLGRRFLWLTSAIGMLISYVSITACSAVYAKNEAKGAGYATIVFLFTYFASYDIAFTGLTVAYPVEILPFSMRTKGVAILQVFVQGALFFNQYVNPIALQALAWKYYIVYDLMLVLSILCIYFFYPETRGLTLEEITVVFDGDGVGEGGPAYDAHHHQESSTPQYEEDEKKVVETNHVEYKP